MAGSQPVHHGQDQLHVTLEGLDVAGSRWVDEVAHDVPLPLVDGRHSFAEA